MIIDDEDYNRVLDKLNVMTSDGHLFIDVSSLVMVNESIINMVLENQHHFTEEQIMSMGSILETYKSMFDTLTNRHVSELVPDDLSDLQNE